MVCMLSQDSADLRLEVGAAHAGNAEPGRRSDVANWPESIKIDYARLIELLMDYGPDLRMPHQKHP